MQAPQGCTKPAAGVMVARPAMAPTHNPTRVGLPDNFHSMSIHTKSDIEAEISEFNSCQKQEQSLKYVCYMMALDGLPTTKQGYFRLLETNKRVILPTNTHLRLLVSAADVLHS